MEPNMETSKNLYNVKSKSPCKAKDLGVLQVVGVWGIRLSLIMAGCLMISSNACTGAVATGFSRFSDSQVSRSRACRVSG